MDIIQICFNQPTEKQYIRKAIGDYFCARIREGFADSELVNQLNKEILEIGSLLLKRLKTEYEDNKQVSEEKNSLLDIAAFEFNLLMQSETSYYAELLESRTQITWPLNSDTINNFVYRSKVMSVQKKDGKKKLFQTHYDNLMKTAQTREYIVCGILDRSKKSNLSDALKTSNLQKAIAYVMEGPEEYMKHTIGFLESFTILYNHTKEDEFDAVKNATDPIISNKIYNFYRNHIIKAEIKAIYGP